MSYTSSHMEPVIEWMKSVKAKQFKTTSLLQSDVHLTQSGNHYNILFIGESGSGKTTFIEALKHYADPQHVLGTEGGSSMVLPSSGFGFSQIETDLPSFCLTSTYSDEPVDLKSLSEQMDQDDYGRELKKSSGYTLYCEPSSLSKARYQLIDTPGLKYHDSAKYKTACGFLGQIKKLVARLNMIIITVSNSVITSEQRNELQMALAGLDAFKAQVVFVHTNVDYVKLHPGDVKFASVYEEKKSILRGLMGGDWGAVKHFVIDNKAGFEENARACITQNTLRELLLLAQSNKQVTL
ncbi:hypothetical protein BG005_011279 [Podila minutissima]|nr:hypothetical protein BG005_011279 [Podila minutissima]